MACLRVLTILLLGAAQINFSGVAQNQGQSVAGTVRLPRGVPAAGVRVMAMVVPGAGRGGMNRQSILARLTQTDKDGRYVLEDLSPGSYFIAAGATDAPTFYPGTVQQSAARAITVIRGGPRITGIDFPSLTTSSVPRAGSNSGPCCYLEGLVLTQDGSSLPAVSLKVVDAGSKASAAVDDGFFTIFLQRTAAAQLSVEGLPPGYSLASIVYGGRNVGTTLQIDGREPNSLLLMVDVQPGTVLPRVSARGTVVNMATELSGMKLAIVLTPTLSDGAALSVPIRPDGSFDISDAPIGAYRIGIQAPDGMWVLPELATIRSAAPDLRVDLRDNPFPEMAGPSPTLFANGPETEFTGVATQRLTPVGTSRSMAYFRMNVRDEATGALSSWAVFVADSALVANVAIGGSYRLKGTVARDGTRRVNAKPF